MVLPLTTRRSQIGPVRTYEGIYADGLQAPGLQAPLGAQGPNGMHVDGLHAAGWHVDGLHVAGMHETIWQAVKLIASVPMTAGGT